MALVSGTWNVLIKLYFQNLLGYFAQENMICGLNQWMLNTILMVIFEYTVKEDSSFAWKSISSHIQFIKENSTWSVGNGGLIKIWKDSWVPGLHAPPEPKINVVNPYSYVLVKDLFIPETYSWNIGLLHDLFSSETASLISGISIHYLQEDKLIWQLEKMEFSQLNLLTKNSTLKCMVLLTFLRR